VNPTSRRRNSKRDFCSYGIRIDPGIRENVLKFNSYMHEAGFVHAAQFVLGTHLVNTCVAEAFCEASPFLLKRGSGKHELTRNGALLAPCEVLATPEWCSKVVGGFRLGDILRPHSRDVIAGMPNPVCCYFRDNEECTFCSLGPYQERAIVPPELVARAALVAQEHNPHYELALSGGTSDTPDRSAMYFAKIAQEVTSRTSMPISVELAPPQDNSFLELLREAGVTAVIMNMEMWDPDLRAIYCPGKSKITVERYLEAIDHAVKLFGRGRVSSVLIAGLQSPATVVEGAGALIARGAIPTIIPFKPFDGSKMARAPVTNPADVTAIHAEVSSLLACR